MERASKATNDLAVSQSISQWEPRRRVVRRSKAVKKILNGDYGVHIWTLWTGSRCSVGGRDGFAKVIPRRGPQLGAQCMGGLFQCTKKSMGEEDIGNNASPILQRDDVGS